MTERLSVRRDPPKRSRWTLLATTAIGVVLGRLFDPVSGRRRRAELRQRTAAFFRRGGRRTARAGRVTGSYAHGYAQRATHVREEPKDFDDATLTHKIESEVFRPADVPKGQININVQNGVVQLRGEVRRPEMINDLEEQIREIQGVQDVENLLHLPGVQPQMHQ